MKKPRLTLGAVPSAPDCLDVPGFPHNPGSGYRAVREGCSLRLNESCVAFPREMLSQPGGKQKLNASVSEFSKLIAHVAASHGCSVPDQLLGVTNLIENFCRTLPADCELLAVPGGNIRLRRNPQHGRIIASGPSLVETMTETMLYDAIWCDSAAFLAWNTYGKFPLHVAALERTPGIDKYFPPEADTRGSTLYTVPTVSPGVLKSWKGAVRFLVQDFPLQKQIFPGVSPIASGASVASLALAVVQYSGMVPVFHGLDLCYSGDSSHAAGLVTGEQQKAARKDVINVGGVSTNSVWKYIADDIEEKLASRSLASSDPERGFGIRMNRPGSFLPIFGLRAEAPPVHFYSEPVSVDAVLLQNTKAFSNAIASQAGLALQCSASSIPALLSFLQNEVPIVDDIISPAVIAICNLVNCGSMDSALALSLLARQGKLAASKLLDCMGKTL